MRPSNARCLSRTKSAHYVNVSPRTFDALVRSGEVRPIQVPGHRRKIFDVPDLDAMVDRWKGAKPPADTQSSVA